MLTPNLTPSGADKTFTFPVHNSLLELGQEIKQMRA